MCDSGGVRSEIHCRGSLSTDVLGEVIRAPAFAGAGDEEPIVVETHLKAPDLIVAIAVLATRVHGLRTIAIALTATAAGVGAGAGVAGR